MFGALVVIGDWSLVSCGVELVMVPGVSTSTVVMLHLCSARIRGDVTRWNGVAGTFVYLNTISHGGGASSSVWLVALLQVANRLGTNGEVHAP